MDEYQELINQIKGKTITQIVASKDSSSGFDLVFDDGSVLELYALDSGLSWVYEENDQ